MNDPNLLRRIKYLTKTYDNIDLGKDFDKAIAQEDKELAKLEEIQRTSYREILIKVIEILFQKKQHQNKSES